MWKVVAFRPARLNQEHIVQLVTVKKTAEGEHVKRGVEAHFHTRQALFTMYQEAFFEKHHSLRGALSGKAENIYRACASGDTEEILKAHLLQAPVTHDVKRKKRLLLHTKTKSFWERLKKNRNIL